MLQIIQVVLKALANGRIASPAANLGPSSDTRLQLMPPHIAGNLSTKNLNEVRPLGSRTHQAHVSTQHIDELGKLVQSRRPQDSAQARDPFVLRRCPSSIAGVGARRHHGCEFIDPESSARLPHALLFEQHGSRGTQPDGGCNQCQQRAKMMSNTPETRRSRVRLQKRYANCSVTQ